MNKAELDEVLRLHGLWLRGKEEGQGANLQGANLQGANLREADLRGADLGGTLVLQSGPIGSRRDYLVMVWLPGWEREEVRAGCWTGTLEELKIRVAEIHGWDGIYGKEYQATIAYFESLLMLAKTSSGPKEEAK